MKIRYRANLAAGCLAILAAIILYLLIPSQVALESKPVHGITSRSLPYALSVLTAVCGVGLVLQSLLLKKDEIRELDVVQEGKGLLYMACLAVYAWGVGRSFLISTCLLGVATLAFTKDKKWLHYLVVLCVVVVIYLMFTRFLHVRLP